jgi:predicted  nucleic acid-binding Zn-ribbon protein
MLGWVRNKLGVTELQERMNEIEDRVSSLESHMERTLSNFGSYSKRTEQELKLMNRQINEMLETLEAIITTQENNFDIEKAIRLRRRLRNHKTRVTNALSA